MIVDANLLLYAVDETSPAHLVSKGWLMSCLDGPERVGFPWASLTAFLGIATNPRIYPNPATPQDAWSIVSSWLESDNAWIPQPTRRHAQVLGNLIVTHEIRADLVSDVHLVALGIEHGVAIASADSDFAKFSEIRWINPLAPTAT